MISILGASQKPRVTVVFGELRNVPKPKQLGTSSLVQKALESGIKVDYKVFRPVEIFRKVKEIPDLIVLNFERLSQRAIDQIGDHVRKLFESDPLSSKKQTRIFVLDTRNPEISKGGGTSLELTPILKAIFRGKFIDEIDSRYLETYPYIHREIFLRDFLRILRKRLDERQIN